MPGNHQDYAANNNWLRMILTGLLTSWQQAKKRT